VLDIGICWIISFVKCCMLTCMSHAGMSHGEIFCLLIFHILKCCVCWCVICWNVVFPDLSQTEFSHVVLWHANLSQTGSIILRFFGKDIIWLAPTCLTEQGTFLKYRNKVNSWLKQERIFSHSYIRPVINLVSYAYQRIVTQASVLDQDDRHFLEFWRKACSQLWWEDMFLNSEIEPGVNWNTWVDYCE
jgi:hypothetical protein